MFSPGQKVVCIDDTFAIPMEIAFRYVAFPRKGKTYTVRNIVPVIAPNGGEGEVTVYLTEITNPVNKHGIEPGYNAERFAPVEQVTETAEETTLASLTL